jgi:hypothetical protein
MELRHFGDCVRGTSSPTISSDEAVEALRLSLAMEEAATTERAIDLRSYGSP